MVGKLFFSAVVISNCLLVSHAAAACPGDPPLSLMVDIAYPITNPGDPNHVLRNERTSAPPGWFIWASNRWADLSYHDPVWAAQPDGGGPDPSGIQGTGVDVRIKVGYEGDTSLKVLGMTYLGQGKKPVGIPPAGNNQICNSWIISHRHWGDQPDDPNSPRYSNGSIFLTLTGGGLIKGPYRLQTYHNCPNNIPWDANSGWYPPDWYVDDGNDRIMPTVTVYGPGVEQKHDEETHDVNVIIQSVTDDDDLIPSVVKWYYNGLGDVTVIFRAAPGGDYRVGGAAVLNAFILEGGDPNMATSPRPASGMTGVHPMVVLMWKPALHAQKHDVYFSTDFDDVNDGIALVSDDQNDNEYDPPGLLTLARKYYWRIDEVNLACPDSPKGSIWHFTIDDGKATRPVVVHGALPQDVNLAWVPGTFAVTHDLYFGVDFDDVNDANTTSGEFVGNFPRDSNSYQIPYLLKLGKTYYWRVDEHNSVYGDAKGNVWTAGVPNYLVIDDFESYNPDFPIIVTWRDGFRWPDYVDGAIIWIASSENDPPDPVHTGKQSLGYIYDNMDNWGTGIPYYSEAELQFEPTRNFAEYGLKALVLYFYGDPNADVNVPYNQMYMTLGDDSSNIAKVDYGHYPGQDMSHLNQDDWHEWNLDLEDFNSAGVHITDVNKLIIGFGIPGNTTTPGGMGQIYFDDIRLYVPRCIPRFGPPADLSADCLVYFQDLMIMAAQWLNTGQLSADLHHDATVDLRDYAVLAENWGKRQYWPKESP